VREKPRARAACAWPCGLAQVSLPRWTLRRGGGAGTAHRIDEHYGLRPDEIIEKSHPGVAKIAQVIAGEYDAGRTTSISNEEMEAFAREHIPELAERQPAQR